MKAQLPLDRRRLKTFYEPVNIPDQDDVFTESLYDPAVTFLEIAVKIHSGDPSNGKIFWKNYGPDKSGAYGSLQGIGGLESVYEIDLTTGAIVSGTGRGALLDYYGNFDGAIDASGEVAWTENTYSGYGPDDDSELTPLNTGSDFHLAQSLSWQAKYIDPTGLYYNGFRYYDPRQKRFISADPLGRGATPDLYGYANGDPVNLVDPMGLSANDAEEKIPELEPFGVTASAPPSTPIFSGFSSSAGDFDSVAVDDVDFEESEETPSGDWVRVNVYDANGNWIGTRKVRESQLGSSFTDSNGNTFLPGQEAWNEYAAARNQTLLDFFTPDAPSIGINFDTSQLPMYNGQLDITGQILAAAAAAEAAYDPASQITEEFLVNMEAQLDYVDFAIQSAAHEARMSYYTAMEAAGAEIEAIIERGLMNIAANDVNSFANRLKSSEMIANAYKFNVSKALVGVINIGRGAIKIGKGIGEISAGVAIVSAGFASGTVTPWSLVAEAGGVMLIGKGVVSVWGGVFSMKRGFRQLNEAPSDTASWRFRNFLGLLPAGQLYDDPGENFETARREYEEMPLVQKIGEILW